MKTNNIQQKQKLSSRISIKKNIQHEEKQIKNSDQQGIKCKKETQNTDQISSERNINVNIIDKVYLNSNITSCQDQFQTNKYSDQQTQTLSQKDTLTIFDLQKKESQKSTDSTISKKWKKLKLLLSSVKAFGQVNAIQIKVDEIEKEVKSVRMSKNEDSIEKDKNVVLNQLSYYKNIEKLCQYATNGSQKDLEEIKALLQQDNQNKQKGKKDLILIDKKNAQGYNAFFLACKNGNIEVLKLLLEHDASPNIRFQGQTKESGIEVAVRWRHEFLLARCRLSFDSIVRSYNICDNPSIKEMLEYVLSSTFKYRFILYQLFPCFTKSN